VGQDTIEWVNIVTSGANCGWEFYEGDRLIGGTPPEAFELTPPIIEYGHTNAPGNSKRVCIIGGVVYRGPSIPQLYGCYLYADLGSGEIWALKYSGGTVSQNTVILTNSSALFTSFGTDPSNGDVLIAAARHGTDSIIQRITSSNPVRIPRITQVSKAGQNIILQGTNGPPNQPFNVLASSSITQSMATWPSVATGSFDSSGNFALTNPINMSIQQRFYRIQVP